MIFKTSCECCLYAFLGTFLDSQKVVRFSFSMEKIVRLHSSADPCLWSPDIELFFRPSEVHPRLMRIYHGCLPVVIVENRGS